MTITKHCLSRTGVSVLLAAILGVTTSCGTILYPERRGQAAGQIDAGVAVLDGIGLLFFLIPGVIAFAVDFGTGAIYLPPSAAQGPEDIRDFDRKAVIDGSEGALTRERLERMIQNRTDHEIDLSAVEVRARKAGEKGEAWKPLNRVLSPSELAAFTQTPTPKENR